MQQINALETILRGAGYSAELALFPGTQVAYLVIDPTADPSSDPLAGDACVGSLVFLNAILASVGQPVSAIDQLQLTLTLPISVPAPRLREFAQCLAAINQRLVLGNMGLTSVSVLYFRYHWQIFDQQFSAATLLKVVALAYQQVALYQPRLQALASGEMQLTSALDFG